MKELALIACLSMLAGCETLSELTTKSSVAPIGSYVAPDIGESEGREIAKDMTMFLGNRFPYAKTTIRLDPLRSVFHEEFIEELRQKGFGVTESDIPGSVFVRYAITPSIGGIVARMRFQGKEASRFYSVSSKGLFFRSPFTVRGASK